MKGEVDKRIAVPLTKEEVDKMALAIVEGHRVYLPKALRRDDAARVYKRAKEIRRELESKEDP